MGNQYAVSPDSRFLGITSANPDLVPGDTNGQIDAFTIDLESLLVTRRSLGESGNQANSGVVNSISLSAGAVHLAFQSSANNLVGNDSNGRVDVFVSDSQPAPLAYCTSKPNSLGCVPAMTWSGSMAVSSGAPFVIEAHGVLNRVSGVLVYSLHGRAAFPVHGGILCTQPPLRRTAIQDSGGSGEPANDCGGVYAFDFAAHVDSGVDPALSVGQGVWTFFWSRDPGFAPPDNLGLTQAVEFAVLP